MAVSLPAVSPPTLPLVSDPGTFRLLAELGVVLLLCFVGLDLSLDQLFTNRTQFVRAGAADVLISAPPGVALGLAFGWSLLESAFLAVAGTTPVFRETLPAFTVGSVLVTATLGTVLMNRAGDVADFAFNR